MNTPMMTYGKFKDVNKIIKYFAYGEALKPFSLLSLSPECKKVGKFTLKGYRRSFLYYNFGYLANIIPDPNSSVVGGLWEIDEYTENPLEIVEGVPFMYKECYTDEGVVFYRIIERYTEVFKQVPRQVIPISFKRHIEAYWESNVFGITKEEIISSFNENKLDFYQVE